MRISLSTALRKQRGTNMSFLLIIGSIIARRVACCHLVSHWEYTDRRTPERYIMLSTRRGHHNNSSNQRCEGDLTCNCSSDNRRWPSASYRTAPVVSTDNVDPVRDSRSPQTSFTPFKIPSTYYTVTHKFLPIILGSLMVWASDVRLNDHEFDLRPPHYRSVGTGILVTVFGQAYHMYNPYV